MLHHTKGLPVTPPPTPETPEPASCINSSPSCAHSSKQGVRLSTNQFKLLPFP